MALVVALAALVLLGAVGVALHAVTLRERRAARRASLARAAADAAEGALVEWRVRLTSDGAPTGAESDPPGTVRMLAAADTVRDVAVDVTLIALAGGARLLVSEARAVAGVQRARRRVALALVPDSVPVASPRDSTLVVTDSTSRWRRSFVTAPDRAWIELP